MQVRVTDSQIVMISVGQAVPKERGHKTVLGSKNRSRRPKYCQTILVPADRLIKHFWRPRRRLTGFVKTFTSIDLSSKSD